MRIEQLTFTRFLAALSIVIFHEGRNAFPFSLEAIGDVFRQANVGVSYFFILSGFVMIIAYGKRENINFKNFIKRRFARIYPAYIFALILLLAYLVILNKSVDFKDLFLNLTMLQSWVPGYALSLNGPAWSLSVELFFYLAFPFLFNHVYKNYSLKRLILPVLLVFVVSQIALHSLWYSNFYQGYPSQSHDLLFYFPLMHLNEFLIGNLAGLLFLKGLKIRNYDIPIIILAILVVVILKLNLSLSYHNGLLGLIFVPLILLISGNNGKLTKMFNMKTFVFLGNISYGIYILRKPVYSWTNGIMKHFNLEHTNISFYLGLITLIIISALSYKLLETPIRKLINTRN